jgi:hypothetical protein
VFNPWPLSFSCFRSFVLNLRPCDFCGPPNTKFDLYILPNVPPNGPDLSGDGYLHTWFFPGMQNNEGATGRTFFNDSCLDVELKNDARDDWPTPPASYRIYIPTMLDQGYDVVFVERFRQLGHPDFKRIFLKRRQYSSKPGLITEGGLQLGGSADPSRPIAAIGGLALAGIASPLSIVTAAGGLNLGGASHLTRSTIATGGLHLAGSANEARPATGTGGLNLAGSSHVFRPFFASGGLHLAGHATPVRRYTASGGLHLGGTAIHHP